MTCFIVWVEADTMTETEMNEYLDDAKSEIGTILTRGRESNRMTQMELSERTGISLKTLSRIENGSTNYTIENLLRILNENGLELIIADKSERKAIVREHVYDSLIHFLIALPFIPSILLYDSLNRICCDFTEKNIVYVSKQFEFLIKNACKNEANKRAIETFYNYYKKYDMKDNDINEKSFNEAFDYMLEYINTKNQFCLQFMLDDVWKMYSEQFMKQEQSTW